MYTYSYIYYDVKNHNLFLIWTREIPTRQQLQFPMGVKQFSQFIYCFEIPLPALFVALDLSQVIIFPLYFIPCPPPLRLFSSLCGVLNKFKAYLVESFLFLPFMCLFLIIKGRRGGGEQEYIENRILTIMNNNEQHKNSRC